MAASSEVIAKDIPEIIGILSDVNDKISDANQRVLSLIEKVNSKKMSTETTKYITKYMAANKVMKKDWVNLQTTETVFKCLPPELAFQGVSFLEMKFHLLLSYLINLVQYMLLKTNGRPIEDSPIIDRLVELRTVMEKIRPIDQKLKYQIDKLVKLATTGVVGQENDPLKFKPRPDNLISKLEPTGNGEDEGKPAVYVPPKVAAMHYDDKVSKRKKSEVAARKKALSSSLLKELRDEYSEAPEEFKEGEVFDGRKDREKDEDEHRQKYEEDNFVRLMLKKRGKSTPQQSRTLDDLTKFTDLSILTKKVDSDESEDEDERGANTSFNRKKRKSKSSGKKNGKKARGVKGSFRRR